ncbi:Integral membrane protein [Mycetocola reblochoni REB411]|uniref:Integral membrane protein n=1 Tax=Mycetocola reblochoni REB411 TaxID=1255698 RepID=A0A1R4J1M6_9MICO|nr:Integral membrane protein [Mycetocola reblochoni REB411]
MVTPRRLLHTAKTAVAATIAWFLGHLVPGELGEYAYYAPLGTLIAMVPTVAVSVRASVQTLVGVVIGVLVAWALLLTGSGGWITVPLAVGIGTLIAGLPRLGPGRDYIPIAALFVVVIGASDADAFSLGYISQMALGAAVGVAINMLVPPPLETKEAGDALALLREDVGRCLRLFADSLDPKEDMHDDSSWTRLLNDVDRRSAAAVRSLAELHESRKGNIRARREPGQTTSSDQMLLSLQRIIRQLYEFADLFLEREETNSERADAPPDDEALARGSASAHADETAKTADTAGGDALGSTTVRRAVAETCTAAAELLEGWNPATGLAPDGAFDAAREALHRLEKVTSEDAGRSTFDREQLAVVVHTTRAVIAELAARLDP